MKDKGKFIPISSGRNAIFRVNIPEPTGFTSETRMNGIEDEPGTC